MTFVLTWLRGYWRDVQADFARFWNWSRKSGRFYLGSLLVHVAIVAALFAWRLHKIATPAERAEIVDTEIGPDAEPEVMYFVLGAPPVHASKLTPQTIGQARPPSQSEERFDDGPVFKEAGGGTHSQATQPILGGLGGFDILGAGDGPKVTGDGGAGIGLGLSRAAGTGGEREGFEGEGYGHREAFDGMPNAENTERAVAAALHWFHRHQQPDGRWSLTQFAACSAEASCGGQGRIDADAAATALALLPFLASGQTHRPPGVYRRTVARGIDWLLANQKLDGDLSAGADQVMYSHALATRVLCEAFGRSRDARVGAAAQRAVRFIEGAQNRASGGWQYRPGEHGDSSSTGWQVLALHSAKRAQLAVDPTCEQLAAKWFLGAANSAGGLTSYLPGGPPTLNMTALGWLCRVRLGQDRGDRFLIEGLDSIQANLPGDESLARDLFATYYITQVLHEHDPFCPAWDKWNERVRRALLAEQARHGCAAGSWYCDQSAEIWPVQGGRLLTTSLAALTLAVAYQDAANGPANLHDGEFRMTRALEPHKARTSQLPLERRK